ERVWRHRELVGRHRSQQVDFSRPGAPGAGTGLVAAAGGEVWIVGEGPGAGALADPAAGRGHDDAGRAGAESVGASAVVTRRPQVGAMSLAFSLDSFSLIKAQSS